MQVMLQAELTTLKAQNAQQPEEHLELQVRFSSFTSTPESVQKYKY